MRTAKHKNNIYGCWLFTVQQYVKLKYITHVMLQTIYIFLAQFRDGLLNCRSLSSRITFTPSLTHLHIYLLYYSLIHSLINHSFTHFLTILNECRLLYCIMRAVCAVPPHAGLCYCTEHTCSRLFNVQFVLRFKRITINSIRAPQNLPGAHLKVAAVCTPNAYYNNNNSNSRINNNN